MSLKSFWKWWGSLAGLQSCTINSDRVLIGLLIACVVIYFATNSLNRALTSFGLLML